MVWCWLAVALLSLDLHFTSFFHSTSEIFLFIIIRHHLSIYGPPIVSWSRAGHSLSTCTLSVLSAFLLFLSLIYDYCSAVKGCIHPTKQIYPCHCLSNVIKVKWKEYARGGSPRSAPVDLCAEAGKCSPGEVSALHHAVFVWQKAYWHSANIKEQFVHSNSSSYHRQLFHWPASSQQCCM